MSNSISKMWIDGLNQEQKEAATYGEGPLLILAGAGSGKTRALTYRVAYLIKEEFIDPGRILLVTFTNKAAKEMKERVRELTDGVNLPWAGTFHSFCAKLLRIESETAKLDKNFAIFDEQDSLEVVKTALDNLDISSKLFKPRSIKAIISQAKNEMVGALEYQQLAKGVMQETVARVYPEYQRLMGKYGAVDFDDLLIMAVGLLKNNKDVLSKYKDRFQYVLVDEYQDTNQAQYLLTKLLSSKWRNLGAVGDFAQSIYSWRGADFRNLKRLQKDFPDIKVINLEQNYRSTKTILEAANQVVSKNNDHPILNLWTENAEGEKVKVFESSDEKNEVEFIVNTIKDSVDEYKDFAVLYRTNAQSRVIEEGFIREGIPYVLVGGVKFYSRKEIKDCLAYLRFVNNPKDRVSYKRIEKIGKRRLRKFEDWLEKDKEKIKEMSSRDILEGVFRSTGYLDKYDPKDDEDMARLENIKELSSVAEELKDLGEFLENVALVEQTDLLEKNSNKPGAELNRVTLMTLHTSKGLEFKNVFMIGMEEGLFPHSRSSFDKQALEEERRLCYVGITRAKKKLWLSYARSRLYFGSRTSNQVSRFLADIKEELIERMGGQDSWLGDGFGTTTSEDDDIINVNDY